ncbi:hypothetical protein J2T13_002764 [Paenibacillus sp. DS2015]|uniref:hypothetical protein n=1 Tax=Paenibacillus sp. DS2015 TaxID=3373917 RepID=UPI003D1A53FB
MESVVLVGALYIMPIVSFLFMFLFLDMIKEDKQGLKFVSSVLFAAICWIISSSIVLNFN